MNRLLTLALFLALGCAGCSSSMDTPPLLQPGVFNERTVDDRRAEHVGINFVADIRGAENQPGD